VPSANSIQDYWVRTREDWPGFFWQLVNVLALSHAFVLINASPETRANHTAEEIETAERQEDLWMDRYGADRERLEAVVYGMVKTCMSGFTDSLTVFTEVRMNVSRCAGKLWTELLKKYPLDHACTRHLLLARELSRAVQPDTSSIDAYNIHSSALATRLIAIQTLKVTPEELFACVELASYRSSQDKHLRKAFRAIKKAIEDGAALSRPLVNKHVKDAIQDRKAGKDVQAFPVSVDGRCPECKGCSLHCKDHKGHWRPAPSSYSSAGSDNDGSDGARRNVRRTSSRHLKDLAAALPHSYPATTERDGNAIIAEARAASKTAAKQAYLMHLAANMTSESDEAGVSDDSHDYYSHNVYSAPGDSD
jgi:hypothetical protein